MIHFPMKRFPSLSVKVDEEIVNFHFFHQLSGTGRSLWGGKWGQAFTMGREVGPGVHYGEGSGEYEYEEVGFPKANSVEARLFLSEKVAHNSIVNFEVSVGSARVST